MSGDFVAGGAHIHGPLRLAEDVAEVVLDPAHENTPVADAATRLPVPVRWHPGFRLHTDELVHHTAYRGPHIVALGTALAEHGWLTPRVLGDAARGHPRSPGPEEGLAPPRPLRLRLD
ncbi:DUF3626 domain-containing protein [Nocardia puris]|uniref:DUF3626 domain-containing protein n=1 Tax=Nocardia puris TaxID=208602 RepID=UPI0018DEB9E1|nr:DUF3626 domain-containing protein [Nocardia puris]